MLAKEPISAKDNRHKTEREGPFAGLFVFSDDQDVEQLKSFLVECLAQHGQHKTEFSFLEIGWAELLRMPFDRHKLLTFKFGEDTSQLRARATAIWSDSRHVLNKIHGAFMKQQFPGYEGFLFHIRMNTLDEYVSWVESRASGAR